VNEAVEQAHRHGLLTGASLMVAAPAAAYAIRRARALPGLRVGLHLVLVDGPAVLGPAQIPDLLDAESRFGADQLRRGFAYFFRPAVRAQLAREIEAQFAAYAATGLPLDHADAHKHMHLHPVVGRLMIDIGRRFGLRALRIPAEPPAVLAACGTPVGLGQRALYRWSRVLRGQAVRAGLFCNDHAFGIAWSGQMTTARLHRLAAHLPAGVSEIYSHPAVARDALLRRLMPDYAQEAEYAALCDPALRAAFAGVRLTSYGDCRSGGVA
jgi:hopanoid biosynthesis associated protein HpnK